MATTPAVVNAGIVPVNIVEKYPEKPVNSIDISEWFNIDNDIKIILLQHGLFFYVNDALEYNKLTGVLPIKSDNYFAWGEESAEYAELTGFSKEKIRIVGNMNLDRKFNKNEDERKKVLLLATGPRNQHHAGYDSRQLDKFEEIVLEICKITSQLDLQLIIKQHSDPS